MSSPASTRLSSDMLDPLLDAAHYPELRNLLLAFDPVVKAFYRAEDMAFDFQRKYRRDANAVEWFGTGAILLAILILVLHRFDTIFPVVGPLADHLAWLEFVAAGIALAVVFLGNGRLHKEGWLVERNRAERCRMLKFRTICDPEIWLGKKRVPIDEFVQGKLQGIETAGLCELWEWIDADPAPCWSWPVGITIFSSEALRQLIDYYRKTRLNFQRRYLDETALRFERNQHLEPSLLSFLFYAGIVCVFVHVLIDLIGRKLGIADWIANKQAAPAQLASFLLLALLSTAFLGFAIAFPAIAAGLRTGFRAREHARNASRYRAKSKALGEIDERLSELAADRDPEGVFRELYFCEYILDLDQREWLRLMIEAEWY